MQNENSASKRTQLFLITTLFGLCNNIGGVVLLSLAHDLARLQNKKSLVQSFGLFFQLSNGLANLTSAFLASMKISILSRFCVIWLMQLLTFLGLQYFTLTLESSNFKQIVLLMIPQGFSSGIGEPTTISVLSSTIGSQNLGGWGFGTGLAGILPQVILLYLVQLGVSTSVTCLIFTSITFIHIATYLLFQQRNQFLEDEAVILENKEEIENQELMEGNESQRVQSDGNQFQSSCFELLPKIWVQILNLFLVYFFEYAIVYTFGEIISNQYTNSSEVNLQIILMQQIGVCVSRTSLELVQIRKQHFLTITQGLLFGLFLLGVFSKQMMNEQVVFALILIVGFMGGGCYINIYYKIGKDTRLSTNEKEFTTSVTVFFNGLGVFLSYLFGLAFTKYQINNQLT